MNYLFGPPPSPSIGERTSSRRAGEQASDEYLLQGGGDMYKPTNKQTKKEKKHEKI